MLGELAGISMVGLSPWLSGCPRSNRRGCFIGQFLAQGGRLLLARDGNLYGVISVDDSTDSTITDYGSVFRVTPAGEYTVFHRFDPDVDGTFPRGGLIEGVDGNFYGTTNFSPGRNPTTDGGTVFQLTPAGVFTTLHDFSSPGSDGILPNGRLVQGADGFLYGTTEFGGTGSGTVFRLSPAASSPRFTVSTRPEPRIPRMLPTRKRRDPGTRRRLLRDQLRWTQRTVCHDLRRHSR